MLISKQFQTYQDFNRVDQNTRNTICEIEIKCPCKGKFDFK